MTSEWNLWWCQYLGAVKIRHWPLHLFVQILCCCTCKSRHQHGAHWWWLPSVWPCSVYWSACVCSLPDYWFRLVCLLSSDYWFNPGNASFFGTNFYPGCHQLFSSFVTLWHNISTSISASSMHGMASFHLCSSCASTKKYSCDQSMKFFSLTRIWALSFC